MSIINQAVKTVYSKVIKTKAGTAKERHCCVCQGVICCVTGVKGVYCKTRKGGKGKEREGKERKGGRLSALSRVKGRHKRVERCLSVIISKYN